MNWQRLYAMLQTWFVISLASVFSAGFYTVIVVGICRKVIGLSDSISVFGIGLPFFIVLLVVLVKYLPKPLRKAGMLSDDPESFGPWFKP
ncbi:hypothetical protein [uncultured Caballeronia sp.]|jgi:hypothetical protein|uniref:hypothetical protein n=1 Tax=uncultured Caballeronia sp. TaxID=1827198 RepID=UPI0035CB04F2